MKPVLKRLVIIMVGIGMLLIVGGWALFAYLDYRNAHYVRYATTGGEIEATYTALGPYAVSTIDFEAKTAAYGKYMVWYPTAMKDDQHRYPLVVMVNGTGINASRYPEVFQHLASWGFIVIGNEDANSRTGASSAESLDVILGLDQDASSMFYGKIDTDHIGIGGHSQGGVGTINAVTAQANGSRYTAMYIASTTSPYWGQATLLGRDWSYDAAKISIPVLMVAGTGVADAGTADSIQQNEGQGISPLWAMQETYAAVPAPVSKVMARQVGKDHGDMLRSADGYMTAWFLYWLKGDSDAGRAFFGAQAEIHTNPQWQDSMTNEGMQ